MKKKSATREFWRKHIDDWCASGLSKKAFCESRQLNISSFNCWTRANEKDSRPGFTSVPIQVIEGKKGIVVTKETVKIEIAEAQSHSLSETLHRLLSVAA